MAPSSGRENLPRAQTDPLPGFEREQDQETDATRRFPKRRYIAPQREHPELAPPKGIPKCVPATCPHPHTFIGRGDRDVEVYSEVLERTVTPEAHTYFRRIVQVTQSELEKLLVYKIQQLFDPVSSSTVNDTVLKELGNTVGSGLQMPGLSAAAHLAELESRKNSSFQRSSTTHAKALAEGEHLSKCLVGALGRILADFGKFADTILRWQSVTDGTKCPGGAIGQDSSSDAFSLTQVTMKNGTDVNAGSNTELKDILERLERQDQENSVLEAKYSTVSNELRDNRRAFIRERVLWREQQTRLKNILRKSTDPNLAKLLEHDVEFYDSGDRKVIDEEEVEQMKQLHKEQLNQMKEEYEDDIADQKKALAHMHEKLLALEERKNPTKELLQKVSELEHAKAELEDTVQHLQAELKALREKHRAAEGANEALTAQLNEALGRMEQAEAAKEALTAKLNEPPPKPDQRHEYCQASTKDWAKFWKRERPESAIVDIPPEADEVGDLRNQIRRMAAERDENTLRMKEVLKELEEVKQAYEALQKELADKETQWEREMKDAWSQTRKLLEKKPSTDQHVQTDGGDEISQRCRQLEQENARLKASLAELQGRYAELEHALEASKRRVKELEIDLASKPSHVVQLKGGGASEGGRCHKGGGFHSAGKAVLSALRSRALAEPAAPGERRTADNFLIQEDFKVEFPSPAHSSDGEGDDHVPSRSSSPPRDGEEKKTLTTAPGRKSESTAPGRKSRAAGTRKKRGMTLDFAETFRPRGHTAASHHAGYRGSTVPDLRRHKTGTLAIVDAARATAATAVEPTQAELDALEDSTAAGGDVQWRAIQGINVPVSGYAGQNQRPRSAGGSASSDQLRTSYGGGFSVLENTGWKGTDHQDISGGEDWLELRPGADTAQETSSGDEVTRPSPSLVPAETAEGMHTMAIQTDSRPQSATQSRFPGTRGPASRSNSVPNLIAPAGEIANWSAAPPPLQGARGLSRPKSASNLPIQPRLTVLHGPPERRNRPQSAVPTRSPPATQSRPQSAALTRSSSRPQSAAMSRPQSAAISRPHSAAMNRQQDAAPKQRPRSAGTYGSALFDSRK